MVKITSSVNYLEILLRSNKTVFSSKEIALLWREQGNVNFRSRLSYYVKMGKLIRLRHGIYAKDKNYNRLELATKIYTPSYISFETVLTRSGISFQYYDKIFVSSYISREIIVDKQKIEFVGVKKDILINTIGIEHKNGFYIAGPERAFLDRIYVSKDYHFDHLDVLNWKKVFEILPMYHNKRMEKKVREYFNYYQKNV